MVRLQIRFEGMSPLLLHNVRLADPLDAFAKKIKEISSNRKKSDDDYVEMAHLEFLASLYFNSQHGVYIPGEMIFASVCGGAKGIRGADAQVRGALLVETMYNPLEYVGPKDPQALYEDLNFRDTRVVRMPSNGARITRTRPKFMNWAVEFLARIDTEILNFEDFSRICERAGSLAGIGDARRIGYGRYSAKINVIEVDDESIPA